MTFVAYSQNSVQYMPPDGFSGFQITQNSISASPLPPCVSPLAWCFWYRALSSNYWTLVCCPWTL